jgi:predicted metal-dependent hydrolase
MPSNEDQEDFTFAPTDLAAVEVRRSARRKRTVTAFRENGRTVVVAPARMAQRDIDAYVRELVGRLDMREQRASSGAALYARAQRLVAEYFERDVLAEREIIIRWVTNQNGRWGSCTPRQGHIRLSHRLMDMPDYVIDCVLLHELAHLIVSNHGPRFRALIAGHPDMERADAYLAGYSLAAQKMVVP